MKKLIIAQRNQDATAGGGATDTHGKAGADHGNSSQAHFEKANGLAQKTEKNLDNLSKDEPEWEGLIKEAADKGLLKGDALAAAQANLANAKTKVSELKSIFATTLTAIATAKTEAGL